MQPDESIVGRSTTRLLAIHSIVLSSDDLPISFALYPGIGPRQTAFPVLAIRALGNAALVAVDHRQRIPEQADMDLLELAITIMLLLCGMGFAVTLALGGGTLEIVGDGGVERLSSRATGRVRPHLLHDGNLFGDWILR